MADSDVRPVIVALRFLLVSVWLSGAVGADEPVTIEPVERWSSVFAESETRWTYRVSSDRASRKTAAWRLTANQHTLASGETEVRPDARKPAEFTIGLRWPPLKEGVRLEAQLLVTVANARHERPVWIHSRDPFADRHEWLERLKLTVFDPPGETVAILEENRIPHEQVRTRESLDEVAEGIVIVGEGVSLKKHDGLIDDLRALAFRGIPVLCFATADGEFSFPGDKPEASAIQLRRSDVLTILDKRFDAAWWPRGPSQLRGLRITTLDDDVVAEVSDSASAWPWAEWTFDGLEPRQRPSRFLWCGFGIVSSWNDGPTPRFLFAKLLERLSPESSTHSSLEN